MTLCAGTAIGVVVGLKDNDEAPKAATETNGVTVSQQELRDLLKEHNEALAGKDLAAFLAPFDTTDKNLVASQTRLFKNLGKLPLSVSHYETLDQQGRTSDSLGRAVTFDLDVQFVHQFDGFDLAPVVEWYRWSIRRESKGAPLKITAVTGAPLGGSSDSKTYYYPGPWDTWSDIHVERTEHVLMMAEPKHATEAKRYAPIAEAAAARNLDAWADGGATGDVPKGFVISLARGKKQLGELYQIAVEKPTEAGFSMPIPSVDPRQSGYTIGGSRVVVDLSSSFFRSGNTQGPREIFRHELAHSLVSSLEKPGEGIAASLRSGLETWTVEGFAEYLAHRGERLTESSRTGRAREFVRGGWDGKLPENFDWAIPTSRESFHYWLGHAAMTYLAEKYGEQRLFEFVVASYRGAKPDDACRKVLGVSFSQFEAGWAGYVRSQVS
ncbi:hypothetical protein ACFQZ8_11950 [Micromonospora azadirachtae]|uniref:Peptidase MA superfamily protein n=1 Tax=Micromonospora azadirachtae TaxID=1970735 RepID=A0ABW3A1T1_9ACTN